MDIEVLFTTAKIQNQTKCPSTVEWIKKMCVYVYIYTYTQAPLPMGCSRQEYWSGLPFPSPGDLCDPGIEPRSPALQADFLATELLRGAYHIKYHYVYI